MPRLIDPRKQAAAALLICLIAVPLIALAAAQPGRAQSQPADADSARYRARTHTAWLPPGRYHSIVIATNADTRRWVVALRTTRSTFPITVAPAETTIVPFPEPWTITAADQVRLESIDVPFGDVSRETPLAEGNLMLSAWGITDTGPVSFVVRRP